MTKKFFITGTGTGVGKSFVTVSLCQQAKAAKKTIAAIKPVISGYDENDETSDTALIIKNLGLPQTKENIEKISPWRFRAPLSPNMAADKEGKKLELAEIVNFCNRPTEADILLIEGAGGICVPLNDTHLILDWIKAIPDTKIITVTGSYLGAISHTLTTYQTMLYNNIPLDFLIISETKKSEIPPEDTAETLRNFLPKSTKLITLAHNSQLKLEEFL